MRQRESISSSPTKDAAADQSVGMNVNENRAQADHQSRHRHQRGSRTHLSDVSLSSKGSRASQSSRGSRRSQGGSRTSLRSGGKRKKREEERLNIRCGCDAAQPCHRVVENARRESFACRLCGHFLKDRFGFSRRVYRLRRGENLLKDLEDFIGMNVPLLADQEDQQPDQR